MTVQRHFGPWDYVVFALMVIMSAAIGIFYGCRGSKQKTTKEFLLANRKLSVVPVAISILVSFMSAILILGTPAEMYTAGTQFFLITGGMVLAVIIAALVFVPLLYPLKLTSSFEYLELRFKSRAVKLIGTVIFIIQQIIYMGIASFAPATALEAVTAFPAWATVIAIGLVATFYTALGGMKAVVWTDVLQSVFMVVGVFAILVKGELLVGGWDIAFQINDDWDRIKFFDFNPDPTQRHSFWSLVVGGTIGWLSTYGCTQASVQRYCSVSSLADAKKTILLNAIGLVLLVTLTCLSGVVIFAYYVQQGCDPLTSHTIDNANQIVPYFVMEVLNFPGLPGLFIACLFSGALSSVSSALSALSAVTWQDILKPFLEDRLTEAQRALVTKLLVLVFGGAGVGMAFMAAGLGGTVLQASLSFTGAASGPLLGLFLLGGLFPWANSKGAVVGAILGLILPLWISFGAYSLPRSHGSLPYPTNSCVADNVTTITMTTAATTLTAISTTPVAPPNEPSGVDLLYSVSYMWYSSIGAATVVFVGLIVSFITGPMSMDEVDPKYLIPLFDRLFCCLPASWRRTLRCNRDFPEPEDIAKSDDVEMIVQSNGTPTQISLTNVAADIHPDGKDLATSPDSGVESDVGNAATVDDDMSNRKY